MSYDIELFEKRMREEIERFEAPVPISSNANTRQRPRKPQPSPSRTGYMVTLAVRSRRLEADTLFEYETQTISRLEAQIEAEKAAKAAGYPIIGHLHKIEKRQ
jgi:hypothetical protein